MAENRRRREDYIYRVYLTDYMYSSGRMKRRWEDIIADDLRPAENRSAGEIKEHMKKKLNG